MGWFLKGCFFRWIFCFLNLRNVLMSWTTKSSPKTYWTNYFDNWLYTGKTHLGSVVSKLWWSIDPAPSDPSQEVISELDFKISNAWILYSYSICGKIRGGQQCIFDVFLTKPGGQWKLGGSRGTRGELNPKPRQIEHWFYIDQYHHHNHL